MWLIPVAIFIIGYHLIKEALEDVAMRNWAISKGHKIYASRTGLRYTKTNKKYGNK